MTPVETEVSTVASYIGGEWVAPKGGASHPFVNPADGSVIASLPYATTADVDRAAKVAHRAFLEWREVPVVDRVQPLYRYKALLEKNADEIAGILTRENGKTASDVGIQRGDQQRHQRDRGHDRLMELPQQRDRVPDGMAKQNDGLKHDHLQVVSTDHCPFCFEDQKKLGIGDFTKIPNGGPGVEHRLQLIHHHGVNSGKLTMNRFVEIVATAPARIFGMYPQKGALEAGSDADIVVWDPKAEYAISAKTHNMRVDYSMFEGFRVRGNARQVFSRGELIVENGKYIGKPGRGKYLRRAARGGAWQ